MPKTRIRRKNKWKWEIQFKRNLEEVNKIGFVTSEAALGTFNSWSKQTLTIIFVCFFENNRRMKWNLTILDFHLKQDQTQSWKVNKQIKISLRETISHFFRRYQFLFDCSLGVEFCLSLFSSSIESTRKFIAKNLHEQWGCLPSRFHFRGFSSFAFLKVSQKLKFVCESQKAFSIKKNAFKEIFSMK